MSISNSLVSILAGLILACPAWAGSSYTVSHDPKTKATVFTFKADTGDVRFNHDKHQIEMQQESCIPCHRTAAPTKKNTMTRFDEHVAHYFCKGCHREKGRGPTECHECHQRKK